MISGFENAKITEITDFYKAPLQGSFLLKGFYTMSDFFSIRSFFRLTLFYFTTIMAMVASAQHADTDVMAPIHKMFEAMAKADTALLQSTFHSDVTFATVVVLPDGNLKLTRENGPQNFKMAIAKLKPGFLQEPIFDYKVFFADGFAQVWAPYALFAGGQFRHCGVDAFQLVLTPDGWKIIHLADTRKKENCQVPDHIMKAYSR